MFIIDEIAYKSHRAAYEKFVDGSTKDISNELPFALPNGWVWTRIGNVCYDFQYGTARKSTKNGNVPVLRMSNLRAGEIDYSDLVYTSDKDDIERYCLNPGDLLFNRTNSSEKVGKVSIFRGKKPCIYAGYLVRFRPVRSDSEFINYMMNSRYQWEFCQSVKTDAVNQSNISASKFIQFLVPLPPLAEQKRIVAKIKELFMVADLLDATTNNLMNTSKQIDKKILDLAIRGKLVPQDPNDEPASELVKRIAASHKSPCKKQSELIHPPFAIPQSWEWVRLGAICEILDSKRKPVAKSRRKPGPYPYYGATCIQDFVSDFIFDEPLVLLGEDGAKWGKGDKSAFCVDGKIWVNNHAHVLRPCDGINHIYLVCTLDILDLMPYVTGTTVPKLNQEKMCDIQIPLPPLAEQKRIVAKIEELRAVIKPLTM